MSESYQCYQGGLVGTNAYHLAGAGGALLIDAPQGVGDWLEAGGHTVDALILTHQHFDHVEGVADVVNRFDCEVLAYGAPSEELIREEAAKAMGLPIHVSKYQVDECLKGLTTLERCGFALELAHVPGHSVDSISIHCPEQGWVATGDTLMAGSIGRSDLPGGDHGLLLRGICEKLYTLPMETTILPGHGPVSTLANEARSNPWVRPESF